MEWFGCLSVSPITDQGKSVRSENLSDDYKIKGPVHPAQARATGAPPWIQEEGLEGKCLLDGDKPVTYKSLTSEDISLFYGAGVSVLYT